jgi:hypothetical protein
MGCDSGCNHIQRLARALHHVMPPGSVNVDVDKAGHDGSSIRANLTHAARQLNFPALSDRGNLPTANDDHGIRDFLEWSKCPVGVNDNRLHKRSDHPTVNPDELGITVGEFFDQVSNRDL